MGKSLWEMESELGEIFGIFDRNGDGKMSLQELSGALSLLGIQPTEDELKVMFNQADTDGNGYIDRGEFMTLMLGSMRLEPPNEEEEQAEAFRAFDRDGSGKISRDELRMAMSAIGEQVDEGELESMLKAADRNGDGEIDMEEFKAMLGTGVK